MNTVDVGTDNRYQRQCPPIRVARMERQTLGVEWPTVTRATATTNDQIRPAASRSCTCGHPVYDDQESRCPLCACQEHKPRLPTAGEHTAPAPVSPGTGEAWRGPQPELSGAARCCLLQQHAAARNLCPRTLLASVTPAARCLRCPAVGRPGRTQPPCGRDRTRRRESRRVRASGPAGPPLPQLAGGTPTSGARCCRPRGALASL